MHEYIRYRGKKYRSVRLHIRTDADFNDILKELNEIELADVPISSEQIMYAILELINNSLRAQKEKRVRKKIFSEFSLAEDDRLFITIRDWGGGFDIAKLPYDLSASAEDVDTNSETFQNYREEHGYMRFGIGLYVVKKTFDSFKLYFIDEKLKPVRWESGKARGTCIELQLKVNSRRGAADG
jgi:anti-sigma regulatory factor (Ser/Thr protein kinase)